MTTRFYIQHFEKKSDVVRSLYLHTTHIRFPKRCLSSAETQAERLRLQPDGMHGKARRNYWLCYVTCKANTCLLNTCTSELCILVLRITT